MKNRHISVFIILFSCAIFAEDDTTKKLSLSAPPVTLTFEKPKKSVLGAMLLSAIYPGLGHVYLNDANTAMGLAGGFTGIVLGASTATEPGFRQLGLIYANNLYSYGLYATFRDVRLNNHEKGLMPVNTLDQLAFAPFNPKILQKPEVYLGTLSLVAVGVLLSSLIDIIIRAPSETQTKLRPKADAGTLALASGLLFFPVGIGEESLFRGVIQPLTMEAFGKPGGIFSSSVLFGAAHIPNTHGMPDSYHTPYYLIGIPWITGLGAYLGWLAMKNNSLEEATAVHFWYDFSIFFINGITASTIRSGNPSFQFAFSF